jgi:hypothetical protein
VDALTVESAQQPLAVDLVEVEETSDVFLLDAEELENVSGPVDAVGDDLFEEVLDSLNGLLGLLVEDLGHVHELGLSQRHGPPHRHLVDLGLQLVQHLVVEAGEQIHLFVLG